MKYSFLGKKDPSEKQLKQLMQEACEEAVKRKEEAEKRYFEELKQLTIRAKRGFVKEHGNS